MIQQAVTVIVTYVITVLFRALWFESELSPTGSYFNICSLAGGDNLGSCGDLWKWGLDGCPGVQVCCLCFVVHWDVNTYFFMILPPQTEPLLHCGRPGWTEISLQRGLGQSGVKATSSLREGVHTTLKMSSP